MGRLRYLANVVTLELDVDKCVGCGMCAVVCPHGVFALDDGGADAKPDRARLVDRDACMECGACAMNCPTGAISVSSGVGCAAAVINGLLRGGKPTCDCGGDGGGC